MAQPPSPEAGRQGYQWCSGQLPDLQQDEIYQKGQQGWYDGEL